MEFADAAILIVFYRGERNDNSKYQPEDNPEFLDMYGKLWNGFTPTKENAKKITKSVLETKDHWEANSNTIQGLLDMVSGFLYNITTKGMKEAVKEVL